MKVVLACHKIHALSVLVYTAGEKSNVAEKFKSEQIQFDSLILSDKNDINVFHDI